MFALPELPYSADSLEPHISRRTLELHHGKHHAGYVERLNTLLGSAQEPASLEGLIREESGAIHRNAAQAWNHELYWQSMRPGGGGDPPLPVAAMLSDSFGGVESFKKAFTEAATGHFGSGWAWLLDRGGRLFVEATHDADCPIRDGARPLLVCDVWEHAYYLDRQNDRAAYVAAWWQVVNWDLVLSRKRL